MGLPPRLVAIRRDFFSEEELEVYKSLYQDVTRRYNTYVEEGTILNNYANVFDLLTRMRQASNHPDLVKTIRKGSSLVCVVCNDEVILYLTSSRKIRLSLNANTSSVARYCFS